MWLTRDALMQGAANGHHFENYVVIVEENGLVHPLEIKGLLYGLV